MSRMSQCVTWSLSFGPTVENEVKEPEERGWKGEVEVWAPFQPLRDDGTCQGTEGADAILNTNHSGVTEEKKIKPKFIGKQGSFPRRKPISST